MTAQPPTVIGGWAGFRAVNGVATAANAATTNLISVLDTVDVPIVVVQREFAVAGFNKAAAHALRISLSHVGRPLSHITALAEPVPFGRGMQRGNGLRNGIPN